MVLYCIDNPVFLECAYIHRMGYNSKKKAILIIDYNMFLERNLIKTVYKMKENKIFDDVLITNMFCENCLNLDERLYEDYIIKFYEKMFKEVNCCINEFDKIYVCNDLWDGNINIYFNLIKRDYVWLAPNTYIYYTHMLRASEEYIRLFEKYSFLNALAPYAKPCFCKGTSKEDINKIGKVYEEWDLKYVINNLELEQIQKIIKCYYINKNIIPSWILITNSYGNMRYEADFSKYIEKKIGLRDYQYPEFFSNMNNIAFDYYIEEKSNIYMKAHPNDPIEDDQLKIIYGDNIKNLSNAPYEIVQRYLKLKAKRGMLGIIVYDSNFQNYIDYQFYNKCWILKNSYLKTWFFYDSIYIILEYANFIQKNIYATFDIFEQLNILCKKYTKNTEIFCINDYSEISQMNDGVVIIDCIKLIKDGKSIKDIIDYACSDSLICFINVDLAETFFEEDYRNMVVPILIEKSKLDDRGINICRDEILWVYSEQIKERRKIYKFKFSKKMNYRGIEINVLDKTPDFRTNIFDYFLLQEFMRKLKLQGEK